MTQSPEGSTTAAKYLFLDVVGFTHNRCVEAQTDIIGAVNCVVREALKRNEIDPESTILLPTGDGICIALLSIEHPFDVHVRLALDIIAHVHEHNANTDDEMRRFELRIGINANIDNLVIDVNGNRNIAGAGINEAQRVMSVADGNQIVVGQNVYNTLIHREAYMQSFRAYNANIKHGVAMPVFQYIAAKAQGLNTSVPSAFQRPTPRLSACAAYRIALCLSHRPEIIKWRDDTDVNSVSIYLYFLVHDEIKRRQATEAHPFCSEMPGPSNAEPETYIASFHAIHWHVRFLVATTLVRQELGDEFTACFEDYECLFPNDKGRDRLKKDWPKVWEEFGLDT